MHAVRTPVFGIGFAIALLLVETLGARAYIERNQVDETAATLDEPPSTELLIEEIILRESEIKAIRGGSEVQAVGDFKRRHARFRACPTIPKVCLDNPLAKGCS